MSIDEASPIERLVQMCRASFLGISRAVRIREVNHSMKKLTRFLSEQYSFHEISKETIKFLEKVYEISLQ